MPEQSDSSLEALQRSGLVAAGYALPFLLILYLSLKGGAYDPIVRGEVGIAVWWMVLLGTAVGALPSARVSRAGWVALALLVGFAVWNALAIGWSESSERSVAELGRVAAYIGVFALALSAQGSDGLRRAVYAVGAAIAVVGVLALLSRLAPDWYPATETATFLADPRGRLSYPLNYWNGLAALIAIGMPLVLWIATSARYTVTRALAAAAVPALSLAAFYTLSRGGAVELAVALVALVALHPRRLSLLPTLVLTGAGSALAIAAASQREHLTAGLTTPAATIQADEMLAITLVLCACVGLIQAALSVAARYEIGPRPRISRSAAAVGAAAAALIAIVVALAIGVPGELSDGWEEFKQPVVSENSTSAERFESASGNGRYQYWSAAVEANATEPLTGIGPGTFQFWWSREGTIPGFVRDAHSLYLETLAELGIVGLLLIGGSILAVLGSGMIRALRASPDRRALLAAATAGCMAFATAAAIDWVWELAVLPMAFLLLAAGILAGGLGSSMAGAQRSSASWAAGHPSSRIALIVLSMASIAAIAVPLAGTASVRASQDRVDAAELGLALEKARTAREIQPYAATASLQEALVLELGGDLDGAVSMAIDATEDEPTNWRTWMVLSRLEATRGNVEQSVAAYRQARSLNPRSPLFQ